MPVEEQTRTHVDRAVAALQAVAQVSMTVMQPFSDATLDRAKPEEAHKTRLDESVACVEAMREEVACSMAMLTSANDSISAAMAEIAHLREEMQAARDAAEQARVDAESVGRRVGRRRVRAVVDGGGC
jgi:hypothetical protein